MFSQWVSLVNVPAYAVISVYYHAEPVERRHEIPLGA